MELCMQVQLRQAHTLRVEAQTFVRSLRTFAPPHLLHRAASRQHNSRAVIAQQLPEVTVLFAGVRDFSTLTGRWSAEHAISVLNELFNPFDDLVAKHGCFMADQSGKYLNSDSGSAQDCWGWLLCFETRCCDTSAAVALQLKPACSVPIVLYVNAAMCRRSVHGGGGP